MKLSRNRPKDIADEIEKAKIDSQKNYDEIKARIDELQSKSDHVPDELKDIKKIYIATQVQYTA